MRTAMRTQPGPFEASGGFAFRVCCFVIVAIGSVVHRFVLCVLEFACNHAPKFCPEMSTPLHVVALALHV